MIKDATAIMLKLIRKNEGLNKSDLFNNDMELQKIVDIILSECRCSVIDKDGDYTRFGSSTDIRIIKMLIQIFLSNIKEIPQEVVAMALTKEGVIGPFKKICFEKIYDEENNKYDIEIEEVFPKEFHVNIFKTNLNVRERFLNEIIKPYVKNIIWENEDLMNKSPITSHISKYFSKLFVIPKSDEQIVKELSEILNSGIDIQNKDLLNNIANYIFVNIMNNKYFKTELINRTLDTTELQKLGKISIGFKSLVENMSYETLKLIELRNFPYGEMISIKDTFYTIIAVLEALSADFDNLDETEILSEIERINVLYNVTNKNKNQEKAVYRVDEVVSNQYGDTDEFVKPENIQNALQNLCKMIKVLLNKKDSIDEETYINEVLRIHYRFIKIQPFKSGNGRTARAIVNVLLQSKGLIGLFRKEKRKDYLEYIKNANKIIRKNGTKYLSALSEKTMECIELENEFLDVKNLPFLLVKN